MAVVQEGLGVGDETSERNSWEATLDDPDEALYTVGVVADLMGVDAQVVRGYDNRGIVQPGRSVSGQRRYSRRDIARLGLKAVAAATLANLTSAAIVGMFVA